MLTHSSPLPLGRLGSNWAISEKQEMIDIVETVFRGASKGRGLVVAPKGTALVAKRIATAS